MRFNLNNMLSDLNQLSQYVESKMDEAEEKARLGSPISDVDQCLFSYAGVLDEFKEYLEIGRENKKYNNKQGKKNRKSNRRKRSA